LKILGLERYLLPVIIKRREGDYIKLLKHPITYM
jgi:hypothetical protein